MVSFVLISCHQHQHVAIIVIVSGLGAEAFVEEEVKGKKCLDANFFFFGVEKNYAK
jgi:hypothetical protein